MNASVFLYALAVGGAGGGVAYARYNNMDAVDTIVCGAQSAVGWPLVVLSSPVWIPAWAIGATTAKILTNATKKKTGE